MQRWFLCFEGAATPKEFEAVASSESAFFSDGLGIAFVSCHINLIAFDFPR
jgi:hypothetical protein